jgi:tRNA(Ile)-lysidine synthase
MAERRPPAVARVLTRITETVRRHDLFEPGDHVLVWVSGGPDSVCLLESLVRLRRLFRLKLSVFHMDHGLRADSADDAAYVRRLAARHGLACHVATPEAPPAKGGSNEAWARYQRWRASSRIREACGATREADGHTMNDQAESVLIGLIRGWGPDGMDGIGRRNGPMVRPMLDVTRDDVEAFCRSLRLRPRRDSTNVDTDLLRNAVRLEVIPAIERASGRGVIETFARTADLQADATAALFELAKGYVDDVYRETSDGFELRTGPLRQMPPGLASWVVRRCFQRGGVGWDKAAIERVLDLADGRPGRRAELIAGTVARRERDHVAIVPKIRVPRSE